MQTPPPPTGPLIDWLRNEAGAPFEPPRGDVGDQVPLEWLPDFAETDSRVPFAVEHLLGEGDRGITDRLLHVANSPAMRRAVAAALPTAATTLAAIPAAGGFTELARAVFALRIFDGVSLSPAAARVLHDIDRTENGWPTSAAIGLALAPDDFLDLLAPAIAAANHEQLSEFSWVLLGGDEKTLAKVLVAAQSLPGSERQKLADAIKRELETKDESRRKLASVGITLPPAESGQSRWQRYAPLLGVAP